MAKNEKITKSGYYVVGGAPPIRIFIFELNEQKADGGPEVVDVEDGLWNDEKKRTI